MTTAQEAEERAAPAITEAAPEARPSFLKSTFASLSEREYAWYFSGNLAFFMAMQMQFILFGFLTFDLTGSAKALGAVAAAFALPTLVAGPISGVIADRVNKRLLLHITQLSAMAMSATMAFLVLTDVIALWHLLAASIFLGIMMSLAMPTRQALVPQLVPRHKLTNAISLQMGSMNLTRILAPALAGGLIGPLGAGYVYVLAASLYFTAALANTRLPSVGMTGHKSTAGFRSEMGEGFKFIWNHETLRLLIMTSLLVPMLGFPVQQMLPVFAREVFDKGPGGLGLMAAMSGVGGLIGAMFAANMDRLSHKGKIMFFGSTIMGISTLGFALSPFFLTALLFLSCSAFGSMMFMTTNNTVIQSNLPSEIRGRVVSVMMMSFGLTPLGVIPVSAAADTIGAPATIAITACIQLVVVATLFARSKTLRNLRLDALEKVELSPVQAAAMVADGRITEEEARRRTGATKLA